MSALRDRRTPVEVEACVEMRRQHTWPWSLLAGEVWHLSETAGMTPAAVAERLGVPWEWVARQYEDHHERLPWGLRHQLQRQR